MEKLGVVKEDEGRDKDKVRKISETDIRQIADVFSGRTNQILCNGGGANIFSIMRKLDQPRRNK